MTRTNKVLIAFLSLIFFIWVLFLYTIQSEFFAKFLSEKITSVVQERLNFEIEFERLEFKLIPLGTILHNVTARNIKDQGPREIKQAMIAKQLGFYFSPVDIWDNKVTLNDFELKDAVWKIETGRDKKKTDLQLMTLDLSRLIKPKKKLNPENSFTGLPFDYLDIQKLIGKKIPLRIKRATLEYVKLNIDNEEVLIDKFQGRFYKSALDLRLVINSIQLNSDKILKPFNLDQFDLDVQLSQDNIRIRRLKLLSFQNWFQVSGTIQGKWKKASSWSINGGTEGSLNLMSVAQSVEYPAVLGLKSGVVSWSSSFSGPLNRLRGKTHIEIGALECDFAKLDAVKLSIAQEENLFYLDTFKVSQDGGRVKLLDRAEIFNWETKEFTFEKLRVHIEKLNTRTFLYAIRNTLYPLIADITGNVEVAWVDNAVRFTLYNGGVLENQRLDFSTSDKKETPVFAIKQAKIEHVRVDWWPLEKVKVLLDGKLIFKNTKVAVKGRVLENEIYFKSEPIETSLDDWGPISGLLIKGKGTVGLEIIDSPKTNENAIMSFVFNTKDTEVLGFSLGDVRSKMIFDLSNLTLSSKEFAGVYGQSSYALDGHFDFGEQAKFDLDARFSKLKFIDFLTIFKPILSDFTYRPSSILGSFVTSFRASGPFDPQKIGVVGSIKGDDVAFEGELFDRISSNFILKKNKLYFEKIKLTKDTGGIYGSFLFDRLSNFSRAEINVKNLSLSDIDYYKNFNLGLNGRINGDLSLQGTYPKLNGKVSLGLNGSVIGNTQVDDSMLSLKINEGKSELEASFLGDVANLVSTLDFNSRSSKTSELKFTLETNQPYLIASVLSEHNLYDRSLNGVVKFDGLARFNLYDFSSLDLDVEFDDFSLQRDEVILNLKKNKNRLKINDGYVSLWDILVDGDGGKIHSTASGQLDKNFNVETYININASLLEVVSSNILKAGGMVESTFVISGENKDVSFFGRSLLKDFSINHNFLPGELSAINGNITYENFKIRLERLKGKFSDGSMEAYGELGFANLLPSLDINFKFDRSSINLFNRTKLIVGGEGGLKGKTLPYRLYGDFQVHDGYISDELTDFAKRRSKGIVGERFIPKLKSAQSEERVNFDVYFDVSNGIEVKNSMLEMRMAGRGRLVGPSSTPRLDGTFGLVGNNGKFLFKSSDFNLTRGTVKFFESDESFNPEIFFQGVSQISDYSLTLVVRGRVNNFEVDLRSDPGLSSEDIFSLLTVGFTGDISKDLQDDERQSLTGVGIGSILFDRFRLNQGLRSTLGLKLSVSPEFTEDDSSLLSGRSNSNSNTSSRLKSATKIRVQKELGDAVDLSVSSTVGGDVQQKQEMNLNYNYYKNFSVQGVYEVKSSEEDAEAETPQSYGVDFIFRWNFK